MDQWLDSVRHLCTFIFVIRQCPCIVCVLCGVQTLHIDHILNIFTSWSFKCIYKDCSFYYWQKEKWFPIVDNAIFFWIRFLIYFFSRPLSVVLLMPLQLKTNGLQTATVVLLHFCWASIAHWQLLMFWWVRWGPTLLLTSSFQILVSLVVSTWFFL